MQMQFSVNAIKRKKNNVKVRKVFNKKTKA